MSSTVIELPKSLVKLKDRQEIAEGTFVFHFEKPANFNFTPGQFVDKCAGYLQGAVSVHAPQLHLQQILTTAGPRQRGHGWVFDCKVIVDG